MENYHLVSILIPNYNSAKYINQTILSASKQTYKNIEIIIVDNCSSDESWDIIQNCAKNDLRIKIFRNEYNIGPLRNWEKCLQNATGIYGKFLWSDDFITEDHVEKLLPFLEDPEIGFVYSKVCHFTDEPIHSEKIIYEYFKTGKHHISKYQYLSLLYPGKVPESPACGLFRLDDLKKNLVINVPNKIGSDFCNHAIGNDALLFLLTTKNYSHFAFVNETLSFFRAHKQSITISTNSAKLTLLYNLAKANFAENNLSDIRLIRRFNTILLINLFKYRNNDLGLNYISDFYMKSDKQNISVAFLTERLVKIGVKKIKRIIERLFFPRREKLRNLWRAKLC
jgi:glycosyltransferase involved in cell wall biosynthesis